MLLLIMETWQFWCYQFSKLFQ